jgi:hypothetical protein
MREMGVRGVLVDCADYHCSHSVALSADRWPDEVRLSDIEPRFVCMPAASAAPTSGRTFGQARMGAGNWSTKDSRAVRRGHLRSDE